MMDLASNHRARMREIRSLDPTTDNQRIAHLIACYEFPWDMTRSLELALFRTFCDPGISALLHATHEFEVRTQRRYDDTDLLISELFDWGYDSERGEAALRRITEQHGRFRIRNLDFLYVLSTFVFEPIRWNARFGWRRMSERERLGLFEFWRQIGIRLGIEDIPEDYDEFEQFNREHERKSFKYNKTNQQVGQATLDMFASWFPSVTRPIVRAAMRGVMDESVITAFGFKAPSRLTRLLVSSSLKARALALRILPKRTTPRRRTSLEHRSYPHGYSIAKLGPPGS